MRRIFTLFSLVALVTVFVPSCSDEESDDSSGDASTDTDVDSDTDTDTDSDSDADGGSDGSTETYDPVTIRITNDAGANRYIPWGCSMGESFYGADAFACSVSLDGEGDAWEGCSIDLGGCSRLCSFFEPGGECYQECEPSVITKEMLPDEVIEITWPAVLFVENTEYCGVDMGTCFEIVPAPTGIYRFTVGVYDAIECGPSPCEPDEGGFYYDEDLPGDPVQYTVEVPLPTSTTVYEIALTE